MSNTLLEKDAMDALYRRFDTYPGFRAEIDEEYTKLLIGKMIYEARTEADLTQKELAELIGTKQSAIARLESAEYERHSLHILQKIASALNKRIQFQFVTLEEANVIEHQCR